MNSNCEFVVVKHFCLSLALMLETTQERGKLVLSGSNSGGDTSKRYKIANRADFQNRLSGCWSLVEI